MVKQIGCAVGVVGALVLGGCGVIQTPSQQQQLLIDSVGDIAAVACMVAKGELDPEDLQKAKVSVLAAQTVLTDPEPKLEDIQNALSHGVDQQWADAVAVLIQRIKVRLNDADVLPIDSVAWRAVSGAIDACKTSLG